MFLFGSTVTPEALLRLTVQKKLIYSEIQASVDSSAHCVRAVYSSAAADVLLVKEEYTTPVHRVLQIGFTLAVSGQVRPTIQTEEKAPLAAWGFTAEDLIARKHLMRWSDTNLFDGRRKENRDTYAEMGFRRRRNYNCS